MQAKLWKTKKRKYEKTEKKKRTVEIPSQNIYFSVAFSLHTLIFEAVLTVPWYGIGERNYWPKKKHCNKLGKGIVWAEV